MKYLIIREETGPNDHESWEIINEFDDLHSAMFEQEKYTAWSKTEHGFREKYRLFKEVTGADY